MKKIRIGSKVIGDGEPVYVIAEAGVNHNGDLEMAKQLVDAAKTAGADAVKFITFTTEEIVTEHAEQAKYQSENTGLIESQASMLKKLELSHEQFGSLKKYADTVGISFLSTPHTAADVDFLYSIDVVAFKVASGDLTNFPLLRYIAKKGKPVILSTGMGTLAEVQEADDVLKKSGAKDVVILQCTSEYPTPPEHVNLNIMRTLRDHFDTPIGFSDHTLGIEVPVYATALGATIIEKHFTLDRTLPGPDHAASLEPTELKEMIGRIRQTKGMPEIPKDVLGSREKMPTAAELKTMKLVRKGIAARIDIRAGDVLNETNIFIARPEGLIPPKDWDKVLGKRAKGDIAKGTSLSWEMIV